MQHQVYEVFFFFFLLKYKSTVSHSPIKWAYYASGIGKPDLCCYCAAEGIQQNNDLIIVFTTCICHLGVVVIIWLLNVNKIYYL
jgi:hypothetical protein